MASSQPRFANRTFHMLSVRHMICKHVPSSMNKYTCTAVRYHGVAQKLLRIARHKMSQNLPLLNAQHNSLFQITIWRQTPLIHLVSYRVITVDSSPSGVTASKFVDIDCACISEIAHTCMQSLEWLHNLKTGTQSQNSENAQHKS